MKIAIISDFFVPHYNGGGERRYYEILKRFVKKGNVVDVYCMKVKSANDFEKIDGINIYHQGPCIEKPPKRNFYQMIKFIISVVYTLRKKEYDHYEAQGIGIFSLYFLEKSKKKKSTAVIHDLSTGGKDQWFMANKMFNILEKIIYKIPINRIITVSNKIKERLIKEYGINEKSISVVHNGVDDKLLDSVPQPKKRNSIIYVGRLIPHKHVDDLISILKEIDDKNIILEIVGTGPEESKLKTLVKELDIEKRVIFFGNLKKYEDVIKTIKANKLLILPSTREGFGLVIVEAMYCGVPVIAYESDGACEVIQNGKNGILVKQRDVKQLKTQIISLLNNNTLYDEISKNALKKVKEFFLWDRSTAELLKIYEGLK